MKFIVQLALILTAPLMAQVTINSLPSRQFGQTILANPVTSGAPNLIEGRELNNPTGIAFDFSVSPPTVYVADLGNNRVLGWKNATNLTKGNFADIVIGQHDFVSTIHGGPGTQTSTGLFSPTAVAVDSKGSVYIMDSGNNRILRFPSPSNGSNPDLVLGQPGFSSGSQPNQGLTVPSAKTLFLSSGGTLFTSGMAFDAQGNLWATDPGNNRVLRYSAASLAATTQDAAADTVLGQFDFASNGVPQPPNNTQIYKLGLIQPSSVAFDSSGRLYVADGAARVLEYQPGFTTGQAADRVLGIRPTPAQGQTAQPYPTQYTLGAVGTSGQITGAPEGVFTVGGNVFIVDSPENRVVWYDTYGNWSGETVTTPSPVELGVLGQANSFSVGMANRGNPVPDGLSLSAPTTGAAGPNNELWIVDTGNNRIIVFPQTAALAYNAPASRLLGQLDYAYNSPNLIEGREVWFSAFGGAGIVVDKSSTPPHLYIADTNNHRILGFKDARVVGTDSHTRLTQTADLVIGQPNLFYALVNYSGNPATSGNALQPSAVGLNLPIGLAVDASGNLYVADSGNGRVVRFPAPFSQPAGATQRADLVLGQNSLTASPIKDPSATNLNTPFGLALFSDSNGVLSNGSLAVSDAAHNRILVFPKPAGGDFSSGMSANAVIGQTDFFSIQAGTTTSKLNSPRHLGVDTSNRLFVADSGNGRLLVFSAPARLQNGAAASLQVSGLSSPQGVAVSLITGESWVTNTNGNIVYRFPEFQTLQANSQPTASLTSINPLAVALDQFDNLILAEGIHRVSFFFPRMYYRHAASYAAGINSTVNLAPGMLTLLARYGSNFSFTPAPVQNLPWQTTLNDIQVFVNGVAAPIYALEPAVIHFQVPMKTPPGLVDFVVQSASTGQILAVGTFTVQQASPGLFTVNQAGTGQVAANNTNPDGTPAGNNSPGNPLTAKGGVITLYLTGQGLVNNPPPDGTAPGSAAFTTIGTPTVNIGGINAFIQFSGLSPQYPGLWQINAVVPPNVLPGNTVPVVVLFDDFQSNYGGTGGGPNGGPGADVPLQVSNGLITTMAIK